MTSRGARTARGAAIAAFATFVASLAHTVGGGAPPGPVAILLALAFSLPLAMLLAGPGVAARARLARTSISALVAQAALHLCYAPGAASVAIPIATTGHAGHAGHHGPGAAVPLDAAMAAPIVDHGHALMPFAHLVAAALTVVALALADDMFDVLHRCVRMFVRRLTALPALAPIVSFRAAVRVDAPRLVGVGLRSALWSRGPPAMIAAS